MSLKLNSSGGGSVTLQEPTTASARTLSLPDNTGTVVSTGSTAVVTPAMLTQPLTMATAQNTTSGTAIDFTGIPSWTKRVTLVFSGLSHNGSTNMLIQIGDSGGIETTGYVSSSNYLYGGFASGNTSSTSGYSILNGNAGNVLTGSVTIVNVSANTWVATGLYNLDNTTGYTLMTAGTKTLSATLDRLRITTTNGTDAFDSGLVNILYEG